jgi:ribosomal protein L11 methyltransferase
VPYRVDLTDPPADALERLMTLGALDVEAVGNALAALLPDATTPERVARAFGLPSVVVSPAAGRDEQSVWVVSPRPVRIGGVVLIPAHMPPAPDAIRLIDGPAFGTGLHPTTALCLEILDGMLNTSMASTMLDIGTGSGVLALAALMKGVSRAVGVDIDAEAVRVAADNAHLNSLRDRLHLVRGGPEALGGSWPLVMANILAAPLMDMAPAVARCVRHGGSLVLSGIPSSLARDVEAAYQRAGLRPIRSETRAGWSALVLAGAVPVLVTRR